MSNRRGASRSRAPQRRAAAKAPARGKATRRRPQRRSASHRRRTFILLGMALAAAAALLWGVVRVGNPGGPQFRLAATPATTASPPVDIEESERREMQSLIERLDKESKQ